MLYVVESTIETGRWIEGVEGNGPNAWQRDGEHITLDGIRASSLAKARELAARHCNYSRIISQVVRKPTESDYHDYEVREGDGNVGCYRRGVVRAVDMSHVILLAKREYLSVPRGAQTDGDDLITYICTYGRGDYCPYVAEVSKLDTRCP